MGVKTWMILALLFSQSTGHGMCSRLNLSSHRILVAQATSNCRSKTNAVRAAACTLGLPLSHW